jgi:hypothetical protein
MAMATAPDTLAPVALRAQGTSSDRPLLGRGTEVIRLQGLTAEGTLRPHGGLEISNSPEWHSLRVFGRGRGRVYFETGDVDLKLSGGCGVWRDGFDAHSGGWPS